MNANRAEAPWAIRHVDLSKRPQSLAAPPDGRPVYAVFWWRELILGVRTFAGGELPANQADLDATGAALAAQVLATRVDALGGPALPAPDGAPVPQTRIAAVAALEDPWGLLDSLTGRPTCPAHDLSVIVCTRSRPQALAACLASLAVQDSPPGEIIVVDNAPEDPATRDVVRRFPQVRWEPEPRPGLSRARNAGIRAATGRLIAFTDDDVEVRSDWTSEVARAFEGRDGVEAVTGLVLPASLETLSQKVFQIDLGGFGENWTPVLFDGRFYDSARRVGVPVWRVGAGANMAFRREAFERRGLFDERLGAGASGCSEDSEFWHRILAGGGSCFYEPRLVVFHTHRAEWGALERQVRAYMRGHAAALFAQHDRDGPAGDLRRVFVEMPKYFVRTALKGWKDGPTARHRLLRHEISGWLSGLQYLWRERRVPAPRLEEA
ncbi:glycosyltransferase family 2 protein [Caulobacter sp. 17J80-11]|uniref:glycosyltransferase family 2 protein n=1 Tax=Caulobacter sp. 17J80-11 TaxID=2763502 RepID=UPI001653918B|nr:glycosyltransferase [Caulobacter sp. 17J80-11]MBC6982440.1 glycosyltransferase [Caulobacter sp. 17J80-11]